MAHAQKPDLVFRRNGRNLFKSAEASVQSTTGSRGVRISSCNAGYTMFRASVKGTGYPLHSPFSPSLPLPCVTVCHHISTGLYSSLPPILQRVLKYNLGTSAAYHISTSSPFIIFIFSTTHCSLVRLIVRPGLDVPTFVTRRLHACDHLRTPSGGRWNCGREMSGKFA